MGKVSSGNNLFGIKWAPGYEAQILSTKECYRGEWITINAQFRKYNSWADSVADHALFLTQNSRYKNLIGVKDYKTVCKLIQADGYATDPGYANMLINIIEQNQLYKFDTEAKTGWYQEGDSWFFYSCGVKVVSQWRQDSSNRWFYLASDGVMAKNAWAKDSSGRWFYLGSDGAMVTNDWARDSSNRWFYLGSDGAMVINQAVTWKDKKYYLGSDGAMMVNTTIDGIVIGHDGQKQNLN